MAEDSAMLCALEAFLQDANSSDVTNEESLPPLTPPPWLVKPRASRSINTSRVRQHQELVILREQVKALEGRIAVAKNRSSSLSIEPAQVVRLLRAEAWHAVATHEKERLSQAEAERERLRREIRRVKKAVRRLEHHLLRNQAPLVEFLLSPALVVRSTTQPIDGVDFSDMVAQFPLMLARVGSVFADSRLSELDGHLRDVRVLESPEGELSVEALDSRLVPFDPKTTADAVWRFDGQRTKHLMAAASEECQFNDDAVYRCMDANFKYHSFRGRARGRVISKRFELEESTVVVLRQIVFDHGTLDGHKSLDPFKLWAFHWTLIRPPQKASLRDGRHSMTQIDTFEIGKPFMWEDREPIKSRETLRQLALEGSSFVSEVERQGVENLLLNMMLNDER